MEDHGLGMDAVIVAPVIPDGAHIAESVIVELIFGSTVPIVIQHVTAQIVRCAHIQVMIIDGRHAPQVTGDEIATKFGGAGGIGAVNTDTAASVVRIDFQIIVLNDIVQ